MTFSGDLVVLVSVYPNPIRLLEDEEIASPAASSLYEMRYLK